MEDSYLDLIPDFQAETTKILQLPVNAKRRLHVATKYNGKNIKNKTKRKIQTQTQTQTRKKHVKQII